MQNRKFFVNLVEKRKKEEKELAKQNLIYNRNDTLSRLISAGEYENKPFTNNEIISNIGIFFFNF